MFDHVTIRVTDRGASERFYETILAELAVEETYRTRTFTEWDDFSLTGADDSNPVTRRLHAGFVAPSRDHVDAFWRAGTEAGYTDDGPPGLRPEYGEDYYGAFLLDPDGNSAEAVHHRGVRRGGIVDHVWIRVADLAASKAYYESIAAESGFRVAKELPGRVAFKSVRPDGGDFSIVEGEPTEGVYLSFARD